MVAKIVYDDGREEEFNLDDYILKDDLDEGYISKEDLEENYVTKEKYDQKKKQAKNAFANQDKAKQEALAEESERIKKSLRDEITFSTKHGFDDIPDEIREVKNQNPNLTWEQAYKISDYTVSNDNPNPGSPNPKVFNSEKKEYTMEELAELPQEQYDVIAEKKDKGEIKIIS